MNETDPSDEELVQRLRVGDGDAATALYARHADLLRGQAQRRIFGGLRRKVGASDLVQDAYTAAFEHLDQFEDHGPGSFRRWLHTILERKVADQVKRYVVAERRSVRREEAGRIDSPSLGPRADGRSPSSLAAHSEDVRTLRKTIDRMAEDDRLILTLVHNQGMDFSQAGPIMDRSTEACRKLYSRAVLRLVKQMRSPV